MGTSIFTYLKELKINLKRKFRKERKEKFKEYINKINRVLTIF